MCATSATVRTPLTERRGGDILEKMTLGERFITCSAPVERRFIKNEGRRVKLEIWRFVGFVIKCGVL